MKLVPLHSVRMHVILYIVLYFCCVCVLVGTNLQALMEQTKRPSSSAEIVVVISNRPGVLGLKRASMAGIQTRVCLGL